MSIISQENWKEKYPRILHTKWEKFLAHSRYTTLASPEESGWWAGVGAVWGYDHEIFFRVQWRVLLRAILLVKAQQAGNRRTNDSTD